LCKTFQILPGDERLQKITPIQLRWILDNFNYEIKLLGEELPNKIGGKEKTIYKSDEELMMRKIKERIERNI